MKNQELEQLLATEMENVHGGAQNQDTCVCERGGAGLIFRFCCITLAASS